MRHEQDFYLDASGLLGFAEDVIHPEPDIRRLKDARYVLASDPGLDGDTPLYYMYRGVYRKKDWETFLEHNIRYDLTVIAPGTIGREYIKTVGHFHPQKPNSTETYPEYYEVLHGEALYLLQKNSRSGDAEEIMAVEAKKNDKVFIPPGYGHVTINPGDTFLVMANLIEKNFTSLYEPFRDKHGAAYYFVQGNSGRGEYERNENYHNSLGLKMVGAPNLPQPIDAVKGKTLYEAFVSNPKAFGILT